MFQRRHGISGKDEFLRAEEETQVPQLKIKLCPSFVAHTHEEALAIRKLMPALMFFHGLFVLCNLIIHECEILLLIVDIIMLALDVYIYQTVYKKPIIALIILLAFTSLCAYSHF